MMSWKQEAVELVEARDLNALRSGKPITAATSGSQPSNEASDEITSESGDCPAAVPHARGHT